MIEETASPLENQLAQSPWKEIGELPRVDMDRVFPGGGGQLREAMDEAGRLAKAFAEKYKGKLAQLSVPDFVRALKEAEDLDSKIGKIAQVAFILSDTGSVDFSQQLFTHLDIAHVPMRFFGEELELFGQEKFQALYNDPEVVAYKSFIQSWLDTLHRNRPSNGVPIGAMRRITRRNLRGLYDNLYDLLSVQRGAETDAKKKQDLIRAFGETHKEVFATILVTLQQVNHEFAQWNGGGDPLAETCHENEITPGELMELRDAVGEARLSVAHKFWEWKVRHLGLNKPPQAAIHQPLDSYHGRIYAWAGIQEFLVSTFGQLSQDFEEIVNDFFSERRIEAKSANAVCLGGDSNFPPVVMLNYWGRLHDVFQCAHEMGHGIHNVYSSRSQGRWAVHANRLISETVAKFSERLALRTRLVGATPQEASFLKACHVDSEVNTVFSEMAKFDFELAIYDMAKNGAVEPAKISDLWVDTKKQCYGDAVIFDDSQKHDWIMSSHTFKYHFYNYPYVFASLLACCLEQDYAKRGKGFVADFTDMLRAGGSKTTHELLAPFGIDVMDKTFWDKALANLQTEVDWVCDNYIGPTPSAKAEDLNIVLEVPIGEGGASPVRGLDRVMRFLPARVKGLFR